MGRLLVSLDQDLADSDRPAAVPKSLLHRLASSHDRDATDSALERKTLIRPAHWGGDSVLDGGEVVEALLYEETDDSVGVEDEVSTVCVYISDFAVVGGKRR